VISQSSKNLRLTTSILFAVAMLIGLNPNLRACADPAAVEIDASGADATGAAAGYRLDSGDKIKMTVYGEDDLSGEFPIDGGGTVRLPLVGEVKAAGLTTSEFEQVVQAKLAHGFLVNPRVNVEVTNYRPFTILGEVNKPGEYPFESGMTILNAVALAGGYTYRAEENTVYIRRKGTRHEVSVSADDKTSVNPGDTVRVAERVF
jgi:protein involved in polysaccharide export with SLBB domain